MKKEKFFEKLARSTPPLKETEQIREQALRDYYHDHPKQKKKDLLKDIAEFGIPMASTGAFGVVSGRMPFRRAAFAGLLPGLLVNQLGEMGRSQKYLDTLGIKSNFIGTKLDPKTKRAKEKYFK